MNWLQKHPRATLGHLGFIPNFLSESDERPAAEQFNDRYAHGGGWMLFKGFKQDANGNLLYSGDPPLHVLWETQLYGEIIRVHESAWVSITKPDGTFEVSRMD